MRSSIPSSAAVASAGSATATPRTRAAEALRNGGRRLRETFGAARRDRDLRARLRQQARGTHAHRSGPRCHEGAATANGTGRLLQFRNGRHGRRVRSVRVEHDGRLQRTEERLPNRRQQAFPERDVGAADENRGVTQVLGAAREDHAVHEIADRFFGDSAVAHDFVRARVERDDAVEDARMRRAVQLKKQVSQLIDLSRWSSAVGRWSTTNDQRPMTNDQ